MLSLSTTAFFLEGAFFDHETVGVVSGLPCFGFASSSNTPNPTLFYKPGPSPNHGTSAKTPEPSANPEPKTLYMPTYLYTSRYNPT